MIYSGNNIIANGIRMMANKIPKKHIQIIQSIDSNIDMYKTSLFHCHINDLLFANFPQEEF
jgi:hypothetical protein